MDKKASASIITIILVISAFAFYWYELRPENIRKSCSKDAADSAVISTQNYEVLNTLKREEKQNELMKDFYSNCIKSKGLEK